MSHVMAPEFFDYEITDIDAYASMLSGASVEIAQLLPGQMRGHHTRIRIPAGELSWITTNLPLRGRAILPRNRWTLSVITRSTGRSLLNGSQARVGSLAIHEPGALHEGVYGRDFSVVCLAIAPDRFKQVFQAGRAAGRAGAQEKWQVYQASSRSRTELLALFDDAARILRHDAVFRGSPAAVEAMIANLTGAFATALGEASATEEQPALRDGAALVCRAEAALAADPDHMLLVNELSEALGVATRSLNRAFDLVLGIGPATYLRRHRLSEARRALLCDQGKGVSVAEVATRFGFRHMGRFSAQYRNLFNELPHVTRRTPERAARPARQARPA